MKKLDTLKKMLETLTDDELNAKLVEIIDNENVIVKALTDKEKLSVLMYSELEKALRTKEHKLLLDCNFADSRNVKNCNYLVDYYRLAVNNAMIQIYVKKNHFNIYTSASKANREKFETLKDELHFIARNDTSYRHYISYDELVDVVKAVIAVLESTATAKSV